MESDSSQDGIRREKKEDRDNEGGFIKPKKAMKTSSKTQKSDEKLDRILKMVTNTSNDVQQLRREIQENNAEIKRLREENVIIKQKYNVLEQENQKIMKDLQILNKRMEHKDRKDRQNNIIVTGWETQVSDVEGLRKEVQNFIERYLEIQVPIREAVKLGQKVCLVSLENMDDKIKIMKNKSKLRDLKAENKYYINHDQTREERDTQRLIRQRAQEEKQNGKQVKVGYRKLIINGQEWRWNDERRVLEKNKISLLDEAGSSKN